MQIAASFFIYWQKNNKSLYWLKSEYRFLYHFGLKIHQHIDRVIENLVYNLHIAIRENYGTRNSVLLIVHHIRECIMTFIMGV